MISGNGLHESESSGIRMSPGRKLDFKRFLQ